ncbi:hypothetical protein [Zhengella mangrovi]|nr:hypothetical protein [Zhengella mangrovi]
MSSPLEQFQRKWTPVSRPELRKNNSIEHLNGSTDSENGFAVQPDQPSYPAQHSRVISLATMIGTVAVTVFFATEALAGAFAMVWAFSGLMHLAPTPTLFLYGLAITASLAATAKVAMLAWDAETDPMNNQENS